MPTSEPCTAMNELELLNQETDFLQVRQTELQRIRAAVDKEEQAIVERRGELFGMIGDIMIKAIDEPKE